MTSRPPLPFAPGARVRVNPGPALQQLLPQASLGTIVSVQGSLAQVRFDAYPGTVVGVDRSELEGLP